MSDIGPDEAREVLKTAPMRMGKAWWGAHPEIEYAGKWLRLIRTDQRDDVATGHCADLTLDEWRAYYLALVRHGARVRHNDSFAVIDSYSDG